MDLLEYDVAITNIAQSMTPKAPIMTEGYKLGTSTMVGRSRSRSMGIDPNKNLMQLAIDMGKQQTAMDGLSGSATNLSNLSPNNAGSDLFNFSFNRSETKEWKSYQSIGSC